jgi:hypothetical protein
MNILKFGQPIKVGALASDPVGAEDGTIYYNTTLGKFRKQESGSFSDIAAAEVLDSVFRITDDSDPTKKIAFQASGISASTTRTITMPDSNVDLGLVATAIQSSEKGAANGVAELDAGGKIPSAQLPPIAITEVFVVADNTARDALTVEEGDVAIVTGSGLTYIYDGAAWQQITAAGAVTSVNGQSGTVSLDTDDVAEGTTNKYYTATQARSDVIASSISDGDTTHAPSGDAVFDALALKLANVVEDTTPQLGGALDQNGQSQVGNMHRAAVASPTDFVEEEYLHGIALSASQTNTVLASLSFAHASFEGQEVVYKMKEASTNRVRIGTLRIVTNGTDISLTDTYNETADLGVTWSAVVNGANIDVRYSSTANAKTMRADVKRFKA